MQEVPNSHRIVLLRFKPLWLYVDAVREFCGFFARATFDDRELGERVGLVVHELVENAIRYGDDQELELQVERGENSMGVIVSNTANDECADALERTFRAMGSMEPADAYRAAVRAAVDKPAGLSGLGLPRIRLEGDVELTLEREPGRVTVTATGRL